MGSIGQMADYSFLKTNSKKKSRWNVGFVVNEKQQLFNPKVFTGCDAINRTADAISAIASDFHGCKTIDEMPSK
jgi:hypothetical protein